MIDYVAKCTEALGDVLACGVSAAYENGLSTIPIRTPHIFWDNDVFGKDKFSCKTFVIYPNINENVNNYEDTFTFFYPKYHIPNKERTILELIKFIDLFGEATLVEGIYMYSEHSDYKKLYELAPKYNVTKDVLDYWIAEAEDWTVV